MCALQAVEPLVQTHAQQSANHLLAALPPDEYQRLGPELNYRPLKLRQTLHKHGERIAEVYFPGRSVCSITNTMEDGGMVEVAMVGREGLVGIGAFLGDAMSTGDAVVQVQAEGAQAMNLDVFRREMDRRGPLYDVVNRYSQAFVGLIMQSVACNGLHSAEERCCRWLLMTRDRMPSGNFLLTHEFLGMMLGVRRTTVTDVMGSLQKAGLIHYRRGHVTILDHDALEQRACECYGISKVEFDRLLGDTPAAARSDKKHRLISEIG